MTRNRTNVINGINEIVSTICHANHVYPIYLIKFKDEVLICLMKSITKFRIRRMTGY